MNKSFWNRIINALALLVFCAMVSTGLVLKFILPPGSGRSNRVAGGRHGGHYESLLGMSRHEWGELHFFISLGFLAVLVVHLFLHWSWIQATAWGTPQRPQSLIRKGMTVVIVALILASLLLPFMLTTRTMIAPGTF